MQEPLLSICIPTYERAEILRITLESIVTQDVDHDLYEICISDNSASNDVENMVAEFDRINIKYRHIKPVGSYLNLYYALEMGSGKYLKLLNDYSIIKNGMLQKIVDEISSYEEEYPVISWSLDNDENKYFSNFDSYLCAVGINITWTLFFGIWRRDFDVIRKKIVPDEMFPHVSLLFEECKMRNVFVWSTGNIFENQELEKKGGYNIPEVFGKRYYGLVECLFEEQFINSHTLAVQRNEIINFLGMWRVLCKFESSKYYFSFENDCSCIYNTFGLSGVCKYYFKVIICYFENLINRLFNYWVRLWKK